MLFRDGLGRELTKGSLVSLAIGNELGMATVLDTTSGLGLDGSDQGEPTVTLQVIIVKSVLKNGIVPGVLRLEPVDLTNLGGA